PETAEKHGVSEGSSIDILSKRGEIGAVKVHLTKTIAPDTVAIPLGFGHTSYTRYATGKGVNPKEIMSDNIDPISGTADWWFTRIKIS
ncbi:molybdopterin oxidoreductase, partial [bacterium]|nr:molybdopterin oxidoreductase [bacterium]